MPTISPYIIIELWIPCVEIRIGPLNLSALIESQIVEGMQEKMKPTPDIDNALNTFDAAINLATSIHDAVKRAIDDGGAKSAEGKEVATAADLTYILGI